MSMPEPMNPYDSPEPVKQGMSGGVKVLLGIGIGCGVLVLLCCGGVGIGGYFFTRNAQQAMSEDPATVRDVATSIVDIDPPQPLKPVWSLNQLWIPLVGTITMAIWAEDAKEEAKDVLILFQLDNKSVTPEMLKAQFEQQMQQSGRKNWEEIQVEKPETIEVEIKGTPAQFTFGKGKRKSDGKEVWQGMGAFDGKGGPAMLYMQLEVEKFTEEQARGTISSMK